MNGFVQKLLLAGSAATLLTSAGAFAQVRPDSIMAPKLKDNAAAAAVFKDVKTTGESAPDPKRPAGGNTNTAHPITNFVPVTDAMLRNPNPANWMMIRGNYQGWGYSSLDKINKTNIKSLQLVWSRLMDPGSNETAPLVYNGVMFLANPNDVIQAINAATGEILWQYRRRLPSREEMHNNPYGEPKRGIAIYNDKIYDLTRDNFLIALDARTGKEVWQVNRGGDYYATNTSAPIVVDGVVLAGSECQEAPFACWVDAHDAETGKLLWHNELIPRPGQPGDETWAGKPFDERWMTDVWGTLTYDPDANILYYGSSGIGPGSSRQRGQVGASLAGTNTRFAVDPKTGKILWRRQLVPEDNWDQDCTFEMMPITTPVHPDAKADGMFSVGTNAAAASRKTLVGAPCKTGVVWSFDALNGTYLWAKSTVLQNVISKIDPKGNTAINRDMVLMDYDKTYHVCPSPGGGRDWPMSAYSPQTNVMYIDLQNLCMDVKVRSDNIPSMPNNDYNTAIKRVIADGKSNVGRVDAVNVETGKTLWSWEGRTSNYSPVLATAGGLVFNGSMDRYLRVLDQADGKQLWQVRLGSSVNGAPVTFSVGGRQYLAEAAGGNGQGGGEATLAGGTDQPGGGNMVYVFALPE